MTTKVLDLSSVLARPAGVIKLSADGREHPVQHLTSALHHSIKTADASNAVERTLTSARAVVPTFSDEEAGRLTIEAAQLILQIATHGIEAAEALIPNVDGPVTPTSPA